MQATGAVVDCAEPALYFTRGGATNRISSKLAAMLQSEGFTKIPLRLNSDRHPVVDCSIDGVPSTVAVDTGSQATLVDKSIGIKAAITMNESTTRCGGYAGDSAQMSVGRVKKIAIGNFQINDADIWFIDSKRADYPFTGLLGIAELAANSAIIDVRGLSMYLRHPQ